MPCTLALGRMLASLVVGLATAAASAQPVTLDSLLSEMIDRAALARFPSPAYSCRQFSSYDRASTDPKNRETWFANADVDQFMREEKHANDDASGERVEYVLMDTDASPETRGRGGAIVRFWSANPPEGATLRFYFDGQTTPGFKADMRALLGGTLEFAVEGGESGVMKVPLTEPLSGVRSKGWNLYLPIPYAKACKVTCDQRGFYYQINYRTYEAGASVETFRPSRVKAGDLQRTQRELRGSQGPRESMWLSGMVAIDVPTREIGPGQSVEVWTSPSAKDGAAIDELHIAWKRAGNANGLLVMIEFDGEPCVCVPAIALAGGMDRVAALQDFFRIASDTPERPVAGIGLRWFMPFRERASVRLLNVSDEPIHAGAKVHAAHWSWDDRSMHFHANWNREYPIHTKQAAGTLDWSFIDIKGQGVYVGDALAVVNPVAAWWGEGDEKIYVDGEAFPSHFGTGTEDYYSYAWCWPEPFNHPFHSQARADGWVAPNKKWTNWGHTNVSRVRSLDAIPFNSGLKFDMEVWHWAEADVAYAATTFWYAKPGASSNAVAQPNIFGMARQVIPPPPELPKPIAIEGAIECESMKVLAKSDGLAIEAQELEGFAPRTWSGGEHLWVKANAAGVFVELEVPCGAASEPAGKAGAKPMDVTLYATKSWDYGVVRFSLNGQPAGRGGAIDLWSGEKGKVSPTGAIPLGCHTPRDGRLVLRAEVVGSNTGSLGAKHFFGLDCVTLKAADAR